MLELNGLDYLRLWHIPNGEDVGAGQTYKAYVIGEKSGPFELSICFKTSREHCGGRVPHIYGTAIVYGRKVVSSEGE